MSRYADGDVEAFVIVYRALAPRLERFVARQGVHRPLDLLQDAFLRIHQARGRFIPGSRVTPWAFAITRRLVQDQRRSQLRRGRVLHESDDDGSIDAVASSAPCPMARLSGRQLQAALERKLADLPADQREAFELIRIHGLTLVEAAEMEGTTVPAMKSRAHRAYEALRSELGDWLE